MWQCQDYLEVLQLKIAENSHVRGYQGQMAKAAGAHPSYFSRVLNEDVFLTPDQAAGLCEFWGLGFDESEFFLSLVHRKRAATPRLKRLLARRLEELRSRNTRLSERIKDHARPSASGSQVYFSAWYFSAVHMALTIPTLRSAAKIAAQLALSKETVDAALKTLGSLGLASQRGGEWHPAQADLHLDSAAAFSATQHAHWRVQTANRVHQQHPDSLHYTGIHSLSRRSFAQIRENLLGEITQTRKHIAASPEEELVCFCLDWYCISPLAQS